MVFDESGLWWNWFLMKLVFDESGFWWKWHFDDSGFLMKVVFDESGFWWKFFLMKVVLMNLYFTVKVWDESVIGRNRFWMKVSLDESVFGWKCFWMSFFCNLDESVPKPINLRTCLECRLPPVLLPLVPVLLLPPLPDVHPGAWQVLHGRSPVHLQLWERGQPGPCHTRHTLWAQGHGARRHQWTEPRELQRHLLPEHPRGQSFLPQRPWRRRRWACRISCGRGRWNGATRWGEKQQWSIFLWHPKREKCSESVSCCHSTQKNDQSNWGVCWRKDRGGAWKL